MAIASITLALLLMPTITFVVIFPIYQIVFAQNNVTQSSEDIQNMATFNTIIAAISGGLVGAAASLIGTYLNNRHNMNIKKQEMRQDLAIELLKHRLESYSIVFSHMLDRTFTEKIEKSKIRELLDQLKKWYFKEKGGLLMSENSKDKYRQFINWMGTIGATDPDLDQGTVLAKNDDEIFWKKAHQFRESLQRDIGVLEEITKS